MGSGASSHLNSISKASDAELSAAMSSLSRQDVQKLEAAIRAADTGKFIVPEKVSECDEKWFTKVLRKAGILDETTFVESINMKELGADEGLTSSAALVEIHYSGGTPESVPKACCVKLPDKSAKMPKDMLHAMFQAEIDIYRHLSVDFASKGMTLPKLFFSACPEDPCTEGYLMVLEHMTHACHEPPFKVGSILDGVPIECALLAVKELAGLHAAYWGQSREALRALEITPGKPKFPEATFSHFYDEGQQTRLATGLKQRVHVTNAVFGPHGTAKLAEEDPQVEGFRKIGFVMSTYEPLVKRRLGVFLKRLQACPLALTHGDCHAENLFLEPGDDPRATWFDFGTLAFRPAVWDLALFLTSSLEPEARCHEEEKLAKCYHDMLLAKGIENYSFEQCFADYRFCACAGFWNIGMLIMARKEKVADENFKMRTKANILTKRVAAALEAAQWGDFFKDAPEDSEEQHPADSEKPPNFE
eukprot:TRINITY_DN20515_c0_g1_i1.p1 TRINITY_DN20515_c0_g1~~TRINITY_DN20515_c0_g1_i1.p1  ORF type:complete len:476 (-),score=91.76 TRINITY_DN20515_c0_g1_i1:83-1510(-)